MGRNAVLGCLSCSCFSSPGKGYANNGFAADANNGSSSDSEVPLPPSGIHASLFSGNGFSADTGSSPDSEVRSSRIHHEVPSYKLMPLPRDRAFPDHSGRRSYFSLFLFYSSAIFLLFNYRVVCNNELLILISKQLG